MKILRKSIILTDKNSHLNKLGVLNLNRERMGVFGNLKLYNLQNNNLVLGLSVNNKQIFKQNVTLNSDNVYSFKLATDIDLDSFMSAVLVFIENRQIQPIIWGSDNKTIDNKNNLIMSLSEMLNSDHFINEQKVKPVEKEIDKKTENEELHISSCRDGGIEKKLTPSEDINKSTCKENNCEELAKRENCPLNLNEAFKDAKPLNLNEEFKDAELLDSRAEKEDALNCEDDFFINLIDFSDPHPSSITELEKTIFSNKLKSKQNEEGIGNPNQTGKKPQNSKTGDGKSDIPADENNGLNDVGEDADKNTEGSKFEEKLIDGDKSKLFETDDEELEKTIDNGMENNFYEMISEQLDELFLKFPRDNVIEKLIPNSKWVKVDYENKGKYYIIGVVYENGQEKYVCFGVPSTYSTEPPSQLDEYAQWLPIDLKNPYENGYWIMYQDAITGDALDCI